MSKMKGLTLIPIFLIMAGFIITLVGWHPAISTAQNWQALPPYNILWPLWSPTMSPPDPVTGVPTPLIPALASDTLLPVQPVMAWNPNSYEWPMSITMPWLFYNGPTGVVFFDAFYGLNHWPPPSYIDPVTSAPIPISLAAGYTFLPLPDLKESQFLFELANLTFLSAYGPALGLNAFSLLSFAEIWGIPVFFAGGIPF